MIALMIFIIALAVLLIEGWCIVVLLLPEEDRMLRGLLALPAGSLGNVLITFACTAFSIPLSIWSLGIGNLLIVGACVWLQSRMQKHHHDAGYTIPLDPPCALRMKKFLYGLCAALLLNVLVFSLVHSVVLHSYAIDSFTNWTMRSRISYEDQAIAFDPTEARGMAKPQYPFLLHALQITVNQGQSGWNDRAANAITELLTLSSLGACFLLLRRLRGTLVATVAMTMISSMPLLSMQLMQGYGDIHLLTYLLLSFLTYAVFRKDNDHAWLWLSAIMMTAALWTKLDGVVFGWLPWILVIIVDTGKTRAWKKAAGPGLLPLALFAPFVVLLFAKGLGITPHAGDMSFAWHPEGLHPAFTALFSYGSFGITWYVLAAVIAMLVWTKKADSVLLWGGLLFIGILFIYLFTPNVEFLINGQSFARQMLIPASLLITACALTIFPAHRHE